MYRTKDQLEARIREIEARLQLIEIAKEKERQRPFFSRNHSHCLFLSVEDRIHTALLKELKWVLYE